MGEAFAGRAPGKAKTQAGKREEQLCAAHAGNQDAQHAALPRGKRRPRAPYPQRQAQAKRVHGHRAKRRTGGAGIEIGKHMPLRAKQAGKQKAGSADRRQRKDEARIYSRLTGGLFPRAEQAHQSRRKGHRGKRKQRAQCQCQRCGGSGGLLCFGEGALFSAGKGGAADAAADDAARAHAKGKTDGLHNLRQRKADADRGGRLSAASRQKQRVKQRPGAGGEHRAKPGQGEAKRERTDRQLEQAALQREHLLLLRFLEHTSIDRMKTLAYHVRIRRRPDESSVFILTRRGAGYPRRADKEVVHMLIGALEAGGTKMVCSIGNPQGGVLQRASFPTASPEVTIPQIVDFMKKFDIKAVGIGSFGPLDLNPASPDYGSITLTPKLEWKGYPLKRELEQRLGIPAGIDTDVNAAALAEYRMGAGKGLGSLLYVTVGTGIGGGLIAGGQLVHGLVHPEIGHMFLRPMDNDTMPDGVCPFHRGCLEGLASGPAIERRWGLSAKLMTPEHPAWALEAEYLAQMSRT